MLRTLTATALSAAMLFTPLSIACSSAATTKTCPSGQKCGSTDRVPGPRNHNPAHDKP